MSALSRLKASPGLLVRALVALGAVAAIAAELAAFASRRVPLGAAVAEEIAVLVVVGALTRRYGFALPGNGFSSYILGVTAYAILDRGWPFGVVVASLAMIAGDLALRRLPVAAALDNAAHLATGAALAGLAYARLGGATGAQALTAGNLVPLVAFLVLLPCVVNGTFYIELALAHPRLGGRRPHRAVGGRRVRLLGGSGPRMPRPRTREHRYERVSRDRRRARERRGRERVGHPAGCSRRRARAHSGLVAGDRAGHQSGQELPTDSGAGPAVGSMGAHGLRALRRGDERNGARRGHRDGPSRPRQGSFRR